MSALAKNIGISDDNTSITKISAYARIDYILRFSKQAILVIDESLDQSNAISGQFLASLPEQHNAAYISLSAQLNNIQIRCRLIEQLGTGELFDPEISLAVSVVNLAKKSQQAISIVLDNAQHLSLQILHEFSQLSAIAKKANLTVNVVLFGSVQAGKTVAENKSLFDNKMALLSAQSGQLLSTTSTLFKNSRSNWHFILDHKWLISALLLLLSFASVIIVLLGQDSFNFSQAIIADKQEKISLTDELAKPQTMVLASKPKTLVARAESTALISAKGKDNHDALALTEDIYHALLNPLTDVPKQTKALPATSADIFSAMTAENNIDITTNSAQAPQSYVPESTISAPIVKNNKLSVNNDYYANKSGYIIQISAFSELKLTERFLATLTTIDYKTYQRMLNQKPVVVVTSHVYADKSTAEIALAALPKSLLARQPWIKPVAVVNNEINAFLTANKG